MKTRTYFLVIFMLMLFTEGVTYAFTHVSRLPPETIVLKLPNDNYADWKEISSYLSRKEGLVERIPVNQSVKDWVELICIQYHDRSQWDDGTIAYPIEEIMKRLEKVTIGSYPGNKVTWRILEKSETAVIYEWILHKPYKDVPSQHEIAHGFLTEHGFHRIGITCKNREMTSEERERWMELLRESVVVIPVEEAKTVQGLSLLNKS